MEKTRLQFQNPQDLINFQKAIPSCSYRIDMTNLILTCDCNEEDIKKALEAFGAKVVALPFSVL
jgi:hypothetical protein